METNVRSTTSRSVLLPMETPPSSSRMGGLASGRTALSIQKHCASLMAKRRSIGTPRRSITSTREEEPPGMSKSSGRKPGNARQNGKVGPRTVGPSPTISRRSLSSSSTTRLLIRLSLPRRPTTTVSRQYRTKLQFRLRHRRRLIRITISMRLIQAPRAMEPLVRMDTRPLEVLRRDTSEAPSRKAPMLTVMVLCQVRVCMV